MAEWVAGRPRRPISRAAVDALAGRIHAPLARGAGENVYDLQARLRALMWDHVGLVRSGDGLRDAIDEIEAIGRRAEAAAVPGGVAFNLAWQDWLNLGNQAAAAWLIARSALERAESRGSHYRRDCPETGPVPYHVYAAAETGAYPRVWTEPVSLHRRRPARPTPEPAAVEAGD
jgi:succinate dehydrogenase/fumarate reductase flavoprotein subunit